MSSNKTGRNITSQKKMSVLYQVKEEEASGGDEVLIAEK